MTTPRILFLDAYDSFSNNITALLATTLHADVHVLPIDATLAGDKEHEHHALHHLLQSYDAVVCGPGPGSPDRAADTGLMRHVWGEREGVPGVTPALGICLGFQSLVVAHGGRIRRLRSGGLHGMVRRVVTRTDNDDSDGLFAGVSSFQATLYHSLGADVGQDAIPAADWASARWQSCGDLQPLAWLEDAEDSDSSPEHLLMAVRHRRLPFWGLQYHPESVCTDAAASRAVLANWFRAAQRWNHAHGRVRLDVPAGGVARVATRPSLLSSLGGLSDISDLTTSPPTGVVCRTIPLPAGMQVPDLVEALTHDDDDDAEHIILDSSAAQTPTQTDPESDPDPDEDRAIRGRFSIVALDVGHALRIEHRAGEAWATVKRPGTSSTTPPQTIVPLPDGHSIWSLLAALHEARRLPPSWSQDRPFVGGFMGYVAYEQGLHDVGVDGDGGLYSNTRPSLCFAWIQHSLVVDHVRGLVHVQHLYGGDDDDDDHKAAQDAVDAVVARLQAPPARRESPPPPTPALVHIHRPDLAAYEAKVRACQEHIAAGDAYELCLTDEARVTVTTAVTTTVTTAGSSSSSSAWRYYRTLRTRNPAPFASYLRLGGATLVSSSPERFLWFGRGGESESEPSTTSQTPPTPTLTCSMRPMKGTVRRSPAVATTAQAAALLRVPKEEAENLMIVDLVRHDLHGVCGPGAVSVPRLLQVEPYGHVFQMVSVVGGVLPVASSSASSDAHTGLDVLAASLPPGSMTGAPKKRSCALLAVLEHHRPRSLYAGVVGYWCATGQGDWSVTIRSLFRWDDETTTTAATATRTETWHVGAGGAVTILSTPEGERDEMLTKLGGPLSVFEDV